MQPDKSIVLPIDLAPPVRAYLHHAHISGILGPELFNVAIMAGYYNVIADRIEPNNPAIDIRPAYIDFFPFYGPDSCTAIPGHKCSPWQGDWTVLSQADMACRFFDALREGRYIEIYLDDYYLHGTSAWNREHRRHHTLVSGYTPDNDSFTCTSIMASGDYGIVTLPRRFLRYALLSSITEGSSWYAAKPMVREVYIGSDPPTITLEYVLRELNRFISSSGDRNGPTTLFGLTAYRYVAENLAACAATFGQTLDLRVTRLLWERQRIVTRRLKLLTDQRAASASRLLSFAVEQEEMTRSLHIQAFQVLRHGTLSPDKYRFLDGYRDVCNQEETICLAMQDYLTRPGYNFAERRIYELNMNASTRRPNVINSLF